MTNTSRDGAANRNHEALAMQDATVNANATPLANLIENAFTDDELTGQQVVDAIATLFDSVLNRLLMARDSRFARAIEGLEREAEVLSQEYDQAEADIQTLEAILPSKDRLTRHEADELLLSGKPDAVANKLAELEALKHKPVAMRKRKGEIHSRLEAIASEKRDIARTIFNEWHAEVVRPVVRASERALFITLLDGLEQSFYQYQERTNTGTADNRQRPLLTQGHIVGLTADERSPEWQSGRRRYGR